MDYFNWNVSYPAITLCPMYKIEDDDLKEIVKYDFILLLVTTDFLNWNRTSCNCGQNSIRVLCHTTVPSHTLLSFLLIMVLALDHHNPVGVDVDLLSDELSVFYRAC